MWNHQSALFPPSGHQGTLCHPWISTTSSPTCWHVEGNGEICVSILTILHMSTSYASVDTSNLLGRHSQCCIFIGDCSQLMSNILFTTFLLIPTILPWSCFAFHFCFHLSAPSNYAKYLHTKTAQPNPPSDLSDDKSSYLTLMMKPLPTEQLRRKWT